MMAKTKASTPPKKGGKTKAAVVPTVPLRKSPRKTVQSVKRLANEILSASSKAIKRAPATKKASPGKVVKRASPVKGATSSAKKPAKAGQISHATASRSPAATKKSASAVVKDTATASLKPKGRPKKSSHVKGPVASRQGRSIAKSPRIGRPRTTTPTKVTAPATNGPWTDSPRKKSPSKRLSRNLAVEGRSSADRNPESFVDDVIQLSTNGCHQHNLCTGEGKGRHASLGGVLPSIESPHSMEKGKARSKHPGQPNFKSPVRGARKSPTNARARSTSVKSIDLPVATRTRSKSPAKASLLSLSKTSACSPSVQSAVGTKRGRSKSPAKAVPQSLVQVRTRTPSVHSAAGKIRDRSKSPIKAGAHGPANAESRNRARKTSNTRMARSLNSAEEHRATSLKRIVSREASRSPGVSSSGDFIRVEKTRSRQSPSRSRQVSPMKRTTESPVRHVPSGSAIMLSPKRLQSPSRSPQRRLSVISFQGRFDAQDETGKALRRIEGDAYKARKEGKESTWRSSLVGRDDEHRARQQGVERAEKEIGLRASSRTKRRASNDLSSPKRKLIRSHSGSCTTSTSGKASGRLPPMQSPAEDRGTIISVTNPEFIPGTKGKAKNPFFETMPGPEVWHRRMPPYFPFGETPYMERVISNQMNADLAKVKERMEVERKASGGVFGLARGVGETLGSLASTASAIFGASQTKERAPHRSPWELPEVTEAEIQEALMDIEDSGRAGS